MIAESAEEGLQAVDFRLQLWTKVGIGWRFVHESHFHFQFFFFDSSVCPTDDHIAPQQRHRIVPTYPFCRRRVRFEAIRPTPEMLESLTIPNEWIEWGEKPNHARSIRDTAGRMRPQVTNSVDCYFVQFTLVDEFPNDGTRTP